MDHKLTENEIKAKVKREFEDYKFYNKQVIGWSWRIDQLEGRIYKTGGSFPKIPEGSNIHDIHKNSPLNDEIEELQRRIKETKRLLNPIDEFKKTLTDEERFILNKLYFDKDISTYKEISEELFIGVRTAKRIVDYVCLNYWHSVRKNK